MLRAAVVGCLAAAASAAGDNYLCKNVSPSCCYAMCCRRRRALPAGCWRQHLLIICRSIAITGDERLAAAVPPSRRRLEAALPRVPDLGVVGPA